MHSSQLHIRVLCDTSPWQNFRATIRDVVIAGPLRAIRTILQEGLALVIPVRCLQSRDLHDLEEAKQSHTRAHYDVLSGF